MVIELTRLQVECGGVVVGADTDCPLKMIDGLGTADLADRIYENPGEDGRTFGREYRVGRRIELQGNVKKPGDEVGAWARSGELAAVFDGGALRRQPRQVTTLRLRRPGADSRVVYGRPRTYEPDHHLAVVGLIEFVAQFDTTDAKFYADTETQTTIVLSVSSSGAIIAPGGVLTSPIRSVAGGARTSFVSNGGDEDTWPVIEITGPVSNPEVTLIDAQGGPVWTIGVAGSIAYDQVAVIDTRPWSRQAALDNGSPLGSPLTRESAPSRSTIPPGSWEMLCTGVDPSGLAEFKIRWRDAYRGI